MRTDASAISSLLAQSASLVQQQAEISKQLSSGTRLGTLSDDPIAAADSVRLSIDLAQNAAATAALQSTQSRMQSADTALAAVVTQLTSAVSAAVSGSNGTLGTADGAALANTLSGIATSVLALANSSYNGSYLFAGTSNRGAAFSESAGTVSYNGDGNAVTQIAGGSAIQTSLTGSAVFGSGASSIFAALQDAATTLSSGATLSTSQVTAIRAGLQTVIDQRSLLAGNAARINDSSTYLSSQSATLQAAQTALAASDPATLATELSASEAQRTALLSSLAVIGKGSLFDYLQ